MTDQRQALIDAEQKAAQLFEEIETRNLITPGKSEKQLSDEVFALATFHMRSSKKK